MLSRFLDYMFKRPIWRLYREASQSGALFAAYPLALRYRLMTVGVNNHQWSKKWERCLVVVTQDGIAVHPYKVDTTPIFICTPDELRWFGRPEKYHDGFNKILIHTEIKGGWQVLSLRMSRGYMQDFVRAIKVIATEEQIKAYRRWRPYIHYGPVDFHPATQDIYGAWDVGTEAFTFYLTPTHIIFLDGEHILRVIDLQKVQKIQSLKRLDAPEEHGVVRFEVEAEKMAFVLEKHEELATHIAEAAKRSLEDPIQQKRKKKDEDDEYEEEYDDDWEA